MTSLKSIDDLRVVVQTAKTRTFRRAEIHFHRSLASGSADCNIYQWFLPERSALVYPHGRKNQ